MPRPEVVATRTISWNDSADGERIAMEQSASSLLPGHHKAPVRQDVRSFGNCEAACIP